MDDETKLIARIHAVVASTNKHDFEITTLDVDEAIFVDDLRQVLEVDDDGRVEIGGVKFTFYTRTSLGIIHVRLSRVMRKRSTFNTGPAPKQTATSLDEYIQWWQDGLQARGIELKHRNNADIVARLSVKTYI